ncbi:hypothetical protein ACFXP7_06820 [Microbacterium sp. P06]|uniref:hypothetical protein n=1 Tax=Microbacterium sp. P06 TaxID=3366949 RepID=UPI003746D363
MIRSNARPAPRLGSTTLRFWFAAIAAVGVLALPACATTVGGAAEPSATPTASRTAAAPSPTPVSAEPEPTPTPTPTATATADPPYNGDVLVVTAEDIEGRLEVTAMVPGVSEDGGSCRLELIGEETSASATSTAGNGVTYCGIMSLTPQASAEEWRFRVHYESASTRAQSAISSVESTR